MLRENCTNICKVALQRLNVNLRRQVSQALLRLRVARKRKFDIVKVLKTLRVFTHRRRALWDEEKVEIKAAGAAKVVDAVRAVAPVEWAALNLPALAETVFAPTAGIRPVTKLGSHAMI